MRVVFQGAQGSFEATTAPDGSFPLVLPPGDYTVRAERDGFLPATRAIKVLQGQELALSRWC